MFHQHGNFIFRNFRQLHMAAAVKRPDLQTLHKEEAPNKDPEGPSTPSWNV